MGKLEFCERFVHLKGDLISFENRPYLPQIYAADSRRIVLRTSRQIEKSTFLTNTLAYELATNPGVQILLVCPRWQQSLLLIQSRFAALLQESPAIRRVLLGEPAKKFVVRDMRFANSSQLHVRAAFHSADSSRGVSADILLIDEYQDVADGTLAVLEETLSHSPIGKMILVGTPKLIENSLQTAYAESSCHEWTIDCPQCTNAVVLDERCLGPTSIICYKCHTPLDVKTGRWNARNPGSTWGLGYWINHLAAPWLNYRDILERQRTYDLAQFRNEVLGMPTSLGEHIVTRAELEACCGTQPMAQSYADLHQIPRDHLIAGIDWGGGRVSRTVVVIGHYRSDNKFVVVHVKSFRADEDPQRLIAEVAELCQRFELRWIGADGRGNGLTTNRLLLSELKYKAHLYGLVYSDVDHAPQPDGTLWSWTIGRSSSIGSLFSLVRKGLVEFPRADDCGWYLDELACELIEYDEDKRRVRYIKPSNQRDDALHATTYAMTMMNRWLDGHIQS